MAGNQPKPPIEGSDEHPVQLDPFQILASVHWGGGVWLIVEVDLATASGEGATSPSDGPVSLQVSGVDRDTHATVRRRVQGHGGDSFDAPTDTASSPSAYNRQGPLPPNTTYKPPDPFYSLFEQGDGDLHGHIAFPGESQQTRFWFVVNVPGMLGVLNSATIDITANLEGPNSTVQYRVFKTKDQSYRTGAKDEKIYKSTYPSDGADIIGLGQFMNLGFSEDSGFKYGIEYDYDNDLGGTQHITFKYPLSRYDGWVDPSVPTGPGSGG